MVDANTKCLIIMPTRSRPVRVLEAVKCFYDTRSIGTEICFVVSPDDPCIDEYMVNLADEDVVVCKDRYIPGKNNYVSTVVHTGLPYYGSIDDDQLCRTKGWDVRFMDRIEREGGWGMACGDDLFTKDWYENVDMFP